VASGGVCWLETVVCPINSAPFGRQNQNGLCERNWRACVTMARSSLVSSQLRPSGVRIIRAEEVSNNVPVKANDIMKIPLDLVYGTKAQFRILLPMSSIAYVRRKRDENHKCEK